MKFYILIILCLIQGLTEFLPVSSSGHLMIAEKFFNITNNTLLLNLFLHLATLSAVVFVYRKNIFELIKNPFQSKSLKLIMATIITVIIAGIYEVFDFGKYLDKYLGIYFLITAILLMITHIFQKKVLAIKCGEIGYKSSIVSGLVQGFAVLPGISRSGSTISSLILLGNDESKSSEFSFLLSIPIIVGGFIFELFKIDNYSELVKNINILEIIFAFVFTFIVAIIAIKITVKLLKKNKFIYFSIYLFILSIFVLIYC